jgi:hemerythrin-like domain-containing protein
MKATANLENDHIYILKLTSVMQSILGNKEPDTSHLEEIVSVIRNFADGLHHAKEEKLLFPKMVSKGFSYQQGPIAVMMSDHEQGRKFAKSMADNTALYKAGDKSVLEAIYASMKGYVGLLRSHIAKEDQILFRLADNFLSSEEQAELLEEFEKTDKLSFTGTDSAGFVKKIDSLALAYNL